MGKKHHPRRGSLQFWPRVRASRQYPNIRTWSKTIHDSKPLAFIGYKAGMTHILFNDTRAASHTKGMQLFCPVTVIECPPLKPLSIRFYKHTLNGLKLLSEVFFPKIDKEVQRRIRKIVSGKEPQEFDEVRLSVYTQPKLTGIGKKRPEILEIKVGGKDEKHKLEYIKSLTDKEIRVSDVFKNNQFLDVHAITKGKGTQGAVKRFGVTIRQAKSEKTKRGVGTLGAWSPKKVLFTVPHAGKMGYHKRTEYNKQVIKLDKDVSKINPKSGFVRYGLVKNDYMIIKGSVPGPLKRTIVFTDTIRAKKTPPAIEIKYLSLESKQGD